MWATSQYIELKHFVGNKIQQDNPFEFVHHATSFISRRMKQPTRLRRVMQANGTFSVIHTHSHTINIKEQQYLMFDWFVFDGLCCLGDLRLFIVFVFCCVYFPFCCFAVFIWFGLISTRLVFGYLVSRRPFFVVVVVRCLFVSLWPFVGLPGKKLLVLYSSYFFVPASIDLRPFDGIYSVSHGRVMSDCVCKCIGEKAFRLGVFFFSGLFVPNSEKSALSPNHSRFRCDSDENSIQFMNLVRATKKKYGHTGINFGTKKALSPKCLPFGIWII